MTPDFGRLIDSSAYALASINRRALVVCPVDWTQSDWTQLLVGFKLDLDVLAAWLSICGQNELPLKYSRIPLSRALDSLKRGLSRPYHTDVRNAEEQG